MNKKREYKYFFTLLALSLLFVSLFSGFVSAEGVVQQLTTFGSSIVGIGDSLFGWLLGKSEQNTEEFVIRIFFFLIVFAMTYVSLEKALPNYFENNGWALWIISIAIPAVAVRFMQKEWLYTLLLPQQAFLASVVVIIPFILYFIITMNFSTKFGRRAAWVIFAVVFLMIYIGASDVVKTTSNNIDLKNVYFYAALGGLLMAIFDGTFSRYYNKFKGSKKMSQHNQRLVSYYYDEWNKSKNSYDEAIKSGDSSNYVGRTPGNTQKGIKGFEKDSEYYTRKITEHGGRL